MRTYIDNRIREIMKRGISMPNPYTPGAGTKPNFLAGRDDTISQITNYINEVMAGEMARHCIFYGVRGVGKTVLLNKIEDIAEENDILFCHIECSEHCSFVKSIIIESQRFIEDMHFSEKLKNKFQKLINIFSFEYDFKEEKIILSTNGANTVQRNLSVELTDLFVTLGRIAQETGNTICFFVDEIQSAENKQLSALIAAVHRINQLRLPVIVIGAGLPTILRVSSEAKSYAERLFQFIEVSYLNEKNAIAAIVEPAIKYNVKYSDKALKKMVKHTGCYPYFIQEFGYCLWENIVQNWDENEDEIRISESHVDSIYEEYMDRLDKSFFGARYNRATKKEKEFLFAMLKCKTFPCSTSQIATYMGKQQKQISPLRSQLMNKGLIYAPSLGEVDFTVPHFDRYLRRLEK